jgi:hypothetical protein
MKLIRYGEPGAEVPGVQLPDGRRIAVDRMLVAGDYDEAFFASGGLARLPGWLDAHAATAPMAPDGVRLGPPIARPSKIICIGLNYRDHAAESGLSLPEEPVIFFKATSAISLRRIARRLKPRTNRISSPSSVTCSTANSTKATTNKPLKATNPARYHQLMPTAKAMAVKASTTTKAPAVTTQAERGTRKTLRPAFSSVVVLAILAPSSLPILRPPLG